MATKRLINEEASILRDVVFSANDGVVTTFAVVAGAFGGGLSASVIIILGFANLVADGISMATGIYMGARSEVDYEKKNNNPHWKQDAPLLQGVVTFLAFCISGLIPLIPFLFNFSNAILYSIIFMSIYLLFVGVIRAILVGKNIFYGAIEVFAVGALASLAAYWVGKLIENML